MSSSRAVTLSWNGKERALDSTDDDGSSGARVFATDDGAGTLHHGDNLAILRALAKSRAESVSLAYLDPPFLTNRVHEALVRGTRGRRGEPRMRVAAFDDRWADQAAYLEAIAPRLVAIRALLAPHGSVVIHVDPKTSHYLKVLADEIFGPEAFASEIVRRYRRWP
ncbi:MAG: DNA methyltransferase, partial [Polyangiales bacterium]